MNTKKHAIHTAESLLARTIEVGDCLEWQGYFANGTPYVSNNGKMTSVRRLFSGLLGKDFVAGGFICQSATTTDVSIHTMPCV